jgi:periplasmic copper chaperone A
MTSRAHATLTALALLLVVGCRGDDTSLGGGQPALSVSAAQASAPVAGASQLVVSIENRGDGADRLVGADTDAALAVEIHRTVIEDDGRAFMRLLDDVVIPAGETVRFRPGGLHLMVVVPDERVRVGGTFTVTLRFERSGPVALDVEVVDLLDLVERDALENG